MSSIPAAPARRRPVKACTECRQVKLRCDASNTYPRPCSRCSTRQLSCIVDPTFRRTPARQRLLNLTRELNGLKEAAQGPPCSAQPPRSDYEGQGSPDDGSRSYSSPRHTQSFCSTDAAFANLEDTTLGSSSFTVADVKTLFNFFYVHLPIIDPNSSIISIQRSSPLLFWTIIIITVRHHSDYSHLLPDLTEPYMKLLRGIITNSPMSLPTVQALLYLCTWPLPVKSQPMDPSWSYCGLCVNAGLYMGLHRPNAQESLRALGISSTNRETRLMTWLACFLVSASLSSFLGLPAPLRSASDLEIVETLLRDPVVPNQFAAQVDIYRCVVKYSTVLADSTDSILNSSLKDIFDREVDAAQYRFPNAWNTQTEVNLLTAKLHIYTTMTVKQLKQTVKPEDCVETNIPAHFSYRSILSYGLTTSVRLIQLICNDLVSANKQSPRQTDEPQPVNVLFNGLPKNYLRTLAFSALFLIKYFALDAACNPDDQNIARNHVIMAYSQFTRFSANPLEETSRAASVIEALSRSPPSPTRGPYALRTSSRLGASIFYDALSTASEIRHLPVHTAKRDESTESNSVAPNYEALLAMEKNADTPTADSWVWNTDLPDDIWNDIDLGTLVDSEEIFVDFSEQGQEFGSHAEN